MKLDYPHQLDKEEALERTAMLTRYWNEKYGTEITWNGDRANVAGKVRGLRFTGTMYVSATHVGGDFQVSRLAEKLGGRTYVERKLAEYLDPRTSVDKMTK